MSTARYLKPARSKPVQARERVAAYRKRMRKLGYRAVETWVPDTRNPKFIAEFQRQCRAVARKERKDRAMMDWLDANTADLVAEIERTERAAGVLAPRWDPAAERPV